MTTNPARRVGAKMKHLQLIVVGLFVGSVAGCNWLTANAPRPLGRAAMLELYLVSAAAVPNSQAAVAPGTGNTIYLVTPPIITSADVATVQKPQQTAGQPGLAVNLSPAGAQKLAAATAGAHGQSLAIVANGNVISVAKIKSTLSTSLVVSAGGQSKFWDDLFEQLTGD